MKRPSIKRPSDNKIGFIIDPDAHPDNQINYILTTNEEKPGYWDVWAPHSPNDKRKERSVREYAQALYILFSQAFSKANLIEKNGIQEHGDKISAFPFQRSGEADNSCVKRIFNVIKAVETKKTRRKYQEIPSSVREGLKPLLSAVGGRHTGEEQRIEIVAECLNRIFFWNIKKEPFNSIDKLIAAKKPLLLPSTQPSSFQLTEIITFSDNFKENAPVKTWLDLYAKYAAEPAYTSSPKWLKTVGLRVETVTQEKDQQFDSPPRLFPEIPRLKTTGLPFDFHEIIQKYKNVLLTGKAGSGKTTAFKLFATSWMPQKTSTKNNTLCFYVRLKRFERFLKDIIATKDEIDIADLIGLSASSVLLRRCSEEEIKNTETIKQLTRKKGGSHKYLHFSNEEMLKIIQKEAASWFKAKGCHNDKLIVLLDGIDEIDPYIGTILKNTIENISKYEYRLAISCRSNYAQTLFSDYDRQITRFELQELENNQISEYLEYFLPGKGSRIFDSQINIDQRLLSMAKNPFYLFLITEKLKKNSSSKIPVTRALLIDDFVISSIKIKRIDKIYDSIETHEYIKDDMIYIVLPKVAKWSLDLITSDKDNALDSFIESKEFNDIHNPSAALITLGMAERYGFLGFSGLLDESSERREYPVFLHNNFRDFFAARYLKTLPRNILLKHLPVLIDYIAWDEPIILLLELSPSKELCQKVVEIILSKDLFFAGMCARHARYFDKELCLNIATRLAKLPVSFKANVFLNNTTFKDEMSHIRTLPTYPLGRFSANELISLAQKHIHPELETMFYVAIQEQITFEDFSLFKSIAQNSFKIPNIKLACILQGIAKIPTYEAFDFIVRIYKQIRTILDNIPDPSNIFENPDPFFIKILFGPQLLNWLAYLPSLMNLIDIFPPDKSPEELAAMLPQLTKIEANELPVLKNLALSDNYLLSLNACQLLTKIMGKEVIPLFLVKLNKMESTEEDENMFLHGYKTLQKKQLRNALLEILVLLMDSNQAAEILINRLDRNKKNQIFQEKHTVPENLLKLLAQTCSPEALNYIVRKASQNYNPALSLFCVDLLNNWPDRTIVLSELRKYNTPIYTKQAVLVSAILGDKEFASKTEEIFTEQFLVAIEKDKLHLPTEKHLLQLYNSDPERWHEYNFEEALATLPMAIRAVKDTNNDEISQKIIQIIEWQYNIITSNIFEDGLRTGNESFESLAESLHALGLFASHGNNEVIENFFKTDILKNLLKFATRDEDSVQLISHQAMIVDSLRKLSETVALEYLPSLLSIVTQHFKNILSSRENARFDDIIKLIGYLCQRLDENTLLDFLWNLKSSLPELSEEKSKILCSLIQKIKFLKGRRFLSIFPEQIFF